MKRKLFGKKIILICVVMSIAVSLFGCGSSLDLTEEESNKIAEYSAGLLLKHDKNYSGSLVEVTEKEVEEAVKGPEIVNDPTPIVKEPEIPPMEETKDSDKASKKKEVIYSEEPLSSFLQTDGFDIAFNGIELAKSYSNGEDGDLAFAFDADPGKDLLILHFNVANNSSASGNIDLLSKDEKYRVKINGEKTVNALTTMLLNDLGQIDENIPQGQVKDTVVVFQIPEGEGSQVQSMDFTVKSDGESATYKLF